MQNSFYTLFISQISTNGIISFGEPFYVLPPSLFPGTASTVAGSYLVSPFWADVDITLKGGIHYEIHPGNTAASSTVLTTVSDFVSEREGVVFEGTWMLVVTWESVPPWPNGIVDLIPYFGIIYSDYDYVSELFSI